MAGPFTPTPIAGLPPEEPDHHYGTPPRCTKALLKVEAFSQHVWEPSAGRGLIADALTTAGYIVHANDIIDRGVLGIRVKDFFSYDEPAAPSIVMNPPFKMADEFILHAINLGVDKIAVFQRIAWLEGERRYKMLWSRHPPIRIWQFVKRQTLWRDDDPNPKDTGGTIAFAWFIWERGFTGAPTIGWLP